jgi:hypothetical protein
MRIRSCFARYLAPVFVFSLPVFALEVGDEWKEPPAELGRPLGRIVIGEKTRYRWPDLEVTVADGRVAQIRRLDAASVAAENEERGKANAAERARLIAERKERTRQEAERAEQALAEQAAQARAASEAAARAEKLLVERQAELAAAKDAAEREKREKLAAAEQRQAEKEQHQGELARKEAALRAKREAELVASARREDARRAAELAKAEAKARADAEKKTRDEAEAKARAAQKAAAASSQTTTRDGVISLVKAPTDPVEKLEREIWVLELDLNRAALGGEPRDRTEAARLRLQLKEKRSQLDAARKQR